MRTLKISINGGLGDFLATRLLLQNSTYDEIYVSPNKQVVQIYRGGDPKYFAFQKEMGEMIFSKPPFHFTMEDYPTLSPQQLLEKHSSNQPIIRPDLSHYCAGIPLDIGEYTVITTKVRSFNDKNKLLSLLPSLIDKLKDKQIVILGEREVENNLEYQSYPDYIFGIYPQLKQSLPQTLDLTVAALGITVPSIVQVRQDLLIMQNAKQVISFGVGGNLWMSMSVANTLGFRQDKDPIITESSNKMCTPHFHPGCFVTQDWTAFLERIK